MTAILSKALSLLDRRERWQVGVLLLLALLNGLTQVAGIGSVMPFIAILTNPALLDSNELLRFVHAQLGAPSTQTFLIMLGFVVLVTFVLSNVLIAVTHWFTYKFSRRSQYRLSLRLFAAYLKRPYVYHIQHNSAEAGRNILTEAQTFTQQILIAGLQAAAASVSALFISVFLIWLNILVAAVAIGVIGGAYGLVYVALRGRLRRLGRNRLRANTARFRAATEAFGAIKEIKVAGTEAVFLERYATEAKRFADVLAAHQIMRNLPQYAIEIIGMGSVLTMVILLMSIGYELSTIAPLVGVYLVAGFRLFPAFQKVYHGISGLRGDAPVVHALHAALADADSNPGHLQEIAQNHEKLPFRKAIEIKNVTFTYPGAERPAVKGINFVIRCGSSVAFVGETGAGKTTLADLIIGLLVPEEGAILVDGKSLNPETLGRWRANLGYVPQHIYLMDDTVARNIAFGVPDAEIDRVALERAARIANIHDFIANELAHGYETIVGERGIRLSGGQRQRLGIARALYHDPELLVLDEATSALDNATEEAVQEAIEQVAQAKTMIIIAHRLSTVRNCDFVYVLKKGRIAAEGSYASLLAGSAQFRALAQANG